MKFTIKLLNIVIIICELTLKLQFFKHSIKKCYFVGTYNLSFQGHRPFNMIICYIEAYQLTRETIIIIKTGLYKLLISQLAN